jgi:hypothetical protein
MHPTSSRGPVPGPPSRSLILSERPVARLQIERPVLKPSVAAVYATATGKAECPGRPLTRTEAMLGHYRTAYEVDTSRHQSSFATAPDSLPARNDRFYFVATVTAGWHVSRPAVVVENGVREGEALVIRKLMDLMRLISRQYEITEAELVEREVNKITANGAVELTDSGLSIDHISAHITVDEAASQFMRDQTAIDRKRDLQQRSHELEREGLVQSHELERQRMRAIVDGVQGQFGLIAQHLRHHPEESLRVLELMHARQRELEQSQQARFANSTEMFNRMLDAGLIQNVDVEAIRDEVLRNTLVTVSGRDQMPAPVTGHLDPYAMPPVSPGAGRPPAIEASSAPVAGQPVRSGPAEGTGAAPPEGSADSTGVVGWRPRKGRDNGTGNAS